MIDVGAKSVCFACDECGIHEQIERRMQVARELGENLQYDHCSCDKVGDEFWAGGYCEDAFAEKPSKRNEVRRKTGRAYRRKMPQDHQKVSHPVWSGVVVWATHQRALGGR